MKNFKSNCKLITDYLGLNEDAIFRKSRENKIVYPRQLIIYYYHIVKGYSIAAISLNFNCVKRTASYNSIKAIDNLMIYKNERDEIIDIFLQLNEADFERELTVINNLPKN